MNKEVRKRNINIVHFYPQRVITNEDFDKEVSELIETLFTFKFKYISTSGIKVFNPTLKRDERKTYNNFINIYDEQGRRVGGFSQRAIKEVYGNEETYRMINFFEGDHDCLYFSLEEDE